MVLTDSETSAAYTLTADVALFALTGEPANFTVPVGRRQSVVAARPRPVIVTETSDLQTPIYSVIRSSGAPVIPGSVAAGTGVFTLSGQAALLSVAGAASERGVFVLSGQVATLAVSKKLVAARGVFTYQLAGVLQTLESFTGSFGLLGQAATLTYGATTTTLSAAGTVFALSGQDVELHWNLSFQVESATFALTGQDVSFIRPARLLAAPGAFSLSGQVATLTAPRIIAYPLRSRQIAI